jgi:hypothetical protein
VDLKVKFDFASKSQIRLMVERFFPFARSEYPSAPSPAPSGTDNYMMESEPHPFTQALMDGIGDKVVSTAQLQDWFIKNLR